MASLRYGPAIRSLRVLTIAVRGWFVDRMRIHEKQRIERGAIAGLFLGLLGFRYRGITLSDAELTLLARTPWTVPFPEISSPLRMTRVLGFPAVVVSLRGGGEIKVAGISRKVGADFVESANGAWSRHAAEQVGRFADELHELARVIGRLRQPRRYPSACLVEPYLVRANRVIESLPNHVPEGVLPAKLQESLDAVSSFQRDPQRIRKAAIKVFTDSELTACREFFDTIESNPLTDEQRLSVVTDEDATLVLAGAGSGKTSVIVAKAAHLVRRGIRQPDEILLMAFGKDAAEEMKSRIEERTGETVDAMTFHSLGNQIIREAEGGVPALAPHASDNALFRDLLKDILKTEIAAQPDLGALLLKWFSELCIPYKSEWDFRTWGEYIEYVEAHELRTLQGRTVKSFEEWEIANWLYLNGIAYEYEPTYEHDLPRNNRRAYTPDFRLTESGVYIEHFGVRKSRGPDGKIILSTAPYMDRKKYLADMEWKRQVHREHGTVLIETFSYEKVEGRLTTALEEKLKPHATPDPVPAEDMFDRLLELGQIDEFTQTLGTFLRHFKGSGITVKQCRKRAEGSANKERGLAFLKIFEATYEAYQERLGDRIDFEDMIVRATGHLKSGRYRSPYRHLLVDEFQDISAGRARLLLALKEQHPDARIFAVGDDWQSIFRFTGSDIHLMRNFGQEFGGVYAGSKDGHETVDLGRTFRSVDRIALAGRKFILRNPSQITKKVVPAAKTRTPAIRVRHHGRGDEASALGSALKDIRAAAKGKASVLLLGRYHFVKPGNLAELRSSHPGLSLGFKTVHASKGLEADHVIILRAKSGSMGFPSEIADDPLLDLVLPEPEKFDHAEERRLFYVALTRARWSVTILADREDPSVFVRELLEDAQFGVAESGNAGISAHRCGACGGRMLARASRKGGAYFACEHRRHCGETLPPCSACGNDLPVADRTDPDTLVCSCGARFTACPSCSDGWLVERRGRYGKFLGCVKYPECDGKLRPSGARRQARRQRSP